MLIQILSLSLGVFFFFQLFVYKFDLLSPSLLFTGGFFLSSLFALFFSEEWNFSDSYLITVVLMGTISFFLGSYIVFMYFKFKDNNVKLEKFDHHVSKKNLIAGGFKTKLFAYFIFQCFLFVLLIINIKDNVGVEFTFSGISNSINEYYELGRTDSLIKESSILNFGEILNTSAIYFFIYLHLMQSKKRYEGKFLVILNILIGFILSVFTGIKTGLFMYLFAFLVLKSIQRDNNKAFDLHKNFKFLRAVFLFLVLFIVVSFFQGRVLKSTSIFYTMSTYIGAPLKNLESYLNLYKDVPINKNNTVFGGETLMNTYHWLYTVTGTQKYNIPSLYDYNWINGEGLGNVYTTFMPFYNDFKLYGVFSLPLFMGMFSQFLYEKVKLLNWTNSFSYLKIFYSYLAFSLAFSFFSNKFFEMIVARSGIYFLLGLLVFKFVFLKLRLK